MAIPLSFGIHEDPDTPAADWVVDNVEYCYKKCVLYCTVLYCTIVELPIV